MQTHDEHGAVEGARSRPSARKNAGVSIAQRALANSDSSALDAGAVLHLQRTAGNESVGELIEEGRSPVLDVVGRGGGQPLDKDVRSEMEAGLGSDLSDVRVHTGAEASASAKAVQAKAYTVGNDVVFGDGAYQPGSAEGRHTLAHELTHVVQQRSGPVDATPTGDGIALSHPDDRFEQAAESTAEKVTAGQTASVASGGAAPAAATAQREGEDELPEEGQRLVQRQGSEEEPVPEEEPK